MNPKNRFYLLPNLVTTLGLFSGFYAIIASSNQQFETACIAIFVAMIFDGLDGRVARMTNSQSEFGAQFDSLADMISFGLAPALVSYQYALASFGKVGWLAVFLYVAFAAMRLARFNTQVSESKLKYFLGLASPAAAGVLSSSIWLAVEFNLTNQFFDNVLLFLTPTLGFLMVSNFRYSAFKEINLFAAKPFIVLMISTIVLVALAARPAEMLFLVFTAYSLSGPVLGLRSLKVNALSAKQDADFNDKKDE